MYDRLWEENPKVQKIRAESEAKGEVQAMQRMLVSVVKARFPALTQLAQEQAVQINSPDALDLPTGCATSCNQANNEDVLGSGLNRY